MSVMSILKFFKPTTLPVVEETGLPDHAVNSADQAVELIEKGKDPEDHDTEWLRDTSSL